MRYSYVSILSTESYLPGALVLHYSLMRTNPRYPFLLLITPELGAGVRDVLSRHRIEYRVLEKPIANPNRVEKTHRWYHNYSTLHIFNLEFEKIVYLDADMLITRNIDELFEKAHLSGVISGGSLPEHSAWNQFNGGLLVIEPSGALFADMLRCVGSIEQKAGGNQAFLHAYFRDWPTKTELHLDYSYNMFHTHVDRYHELLGYMLEDIKVLHFIGANKPWMIQGAEISRQRIGFRRKATTLAKRLLGKRSRFSNREMHDEAIRMWQSHHEEMVREYGDSFAAAGLRPGTGSRA